MTDILTRPQDFLSSNVVFYNNLIIHQHPTLLFKETKDDLLERIITNAKAYTHISKRIKISLDKCMEIFWSKKVLEETKKETYPIFEESKYVSKIASELKAYGNETGKAIFVVRREYDVRKQMEKQGARPDVVIILSQAQPSYETEKMAEIVMSVKETCKKKRSVPEFTGAQERLKHVLGTARDDIAALFQQHEFTHYETEIEYKNFNLCKDEDQQMIKLIDDSPDKMVEKPASFMIHKADEILGDCLKILDNFGTYGLIRWFPDLQLRLSLLGTTYEKSPLNNKSDANIMINIIFDMVLTTFFSCQAVIEELNEIEDKECLLSDRLWMFLWDIRERFNPPKHKEESNDTSDLSEAEPDSDDERRAKEIKKHEFRDSENELPSWFTEFDVKTVKKAPSSVTKFNPYEKPVEEMIGVGFGKYIVNFNNEVLCYAFHTALKTMNEREFPLFSCIIPFFKTTKSLQLGTPFKSSMRNSALVGESNERTFKKKDKETAERMKSGLEQFMDGTNLSGLLITTSSVPKYVIDGLVTQGKCPISMGYRFEEPNKDYFNLPVRDGAIQLVVNMNTYDKMTDVNKEIKRFAEGGCTKLKIQSDPDIFSELLESSEDGVDIADDFVLEGFPENKSSQDILRDIVSKVCVHDIYSNFKINTAKQDDGRWVAIAGFPMDFPISKKVFTSGLFADEDEAVDNVCKIAITRFKKDNQDDFLFLRNPKIDNEEKREKYHTRGPREFEEDLPVHPFTESANYEKYLIDNKKQYRRIFPECLQGGPLEPGKPCYLYLVKICKTNRSCENEKIKTSTEEKFPYDFSERAFGILVAKPIVSVAPFSIYHPKKKKTTFALDVEVTLLRSMLVFDEVELKQLNHFYRVVTELHDGHMVDGHFDSCIPAADVVKTHQLICEAEKETQSDRKKAEQSGWEKSRSTPKYHELKPWLRKGEIQLLYVPLAKRQLPWHGFDIDWFTITEMEVFESRCCQIARARNQNWSKKNEAIAELLRIRKQYSQKREDGSVHPEYARKSEEIAFLKKDLHLLNSSEDKTTVPHPLIPKKNGKIIRRRHEDRITKVWEDQRVWYEPYHKADASFELNILMKPSKQIEMIRGREFHWRQEVKKITIYVQKKPGDSKTQVHVCQVVQTSEFAWRLPVPLCGEKSCSLCPHEPTRKKHFYGELNEVFDRGQHDLKIYHKEDILVWQPRSENYYLSAEFSDKDGATNDYNLQKPQTYNDYHKKIKPEFAGKGKKLVRISESFINSKQTMITRHPPEGGKLNSSKLLFMEHIEYHFLPKFMFIQASKLPGITVRLIQLLNAEELRIKFTKEYNTQIFPSLAEGNLTKKPGLSPMELYAMLSKSPLTSYKITTVKRFKGYVEGTEFKNETFLFNNLAPAACEFGYKAKDEESIADPKNGVEYTYKKIKVSENKLPAPVNSVNFERLFDSLGPVYPPPVFGERSYYLPPHVDKILDHKVPMIPEKHDKLDFGLLSNAINAQEKQAWALRRRDPKKTKTLYSDFSCWSQPRIDEQIDKEHFEREKDWYGENEIEVFEKNVQKHPATFIPWFSEKKQGIIDESLKHFKSFGKFSENNKEGDAREKAQADLVRQALGRLVVQSNCSDWFLKLQRSAAIYKEEMDSQTDSENSSTHLSLTNDNYEHRKITKLLNRIEQKSPEPPVDFLARECFAPPPSLLLRALTQPTANDFFNLERLEFFGDSFIKIACTRMLYEKYAHFSDGELTSARGAYISNANFLKLLKLRLSDGSCLQIPRYMNCYDNSRKSSGVIRAPGYVYSYKLDDNGDETEIFPPMTDCSQFVSENFRDTHFNYMFFDSKDKRVDKKTADVVESLIGAYLVTGGEKMAARFVIMLNNLYKMTVDSSPEFLEGVRRKRTVEGDCLISPEPSYWPDNAFEASKAFGEDHENYTEDLVEPDPRTQSIIDELQNELEYTFKTPHLCRLALAKKKYTKDPKDNFERLEFLGDAVLDYLVVDELYNRRSAALDSGQLTDLKQSITSNNLFGSLAFCMGLPQSTLMKASAAKDHISCMYKLEQFKNLLNKPKHGVPLNPDLKRVLEKANWNNKTSNRAGPYSCPYLLDIPKWFGDVFESMFGAVWLDCNQCLPEIWDIYKSKIIPVMGIEGNRAYDPEFINTLNPRREIGKRKYRIEETTSSKPEKLNTKDKIRVFLKKKKMEEFTEDSLRFTGYYFCFAEISQDQNRDLKKRDFGIGPSENSATFAAYHRLLFQLNL